MRGARRTGAGAAAWAAVLLALAAGAAAQSSRDAERKLDRIHRELRDVAAERRKIEGQRGAASRELREVDERLGHSSRALHETEDQLARQQAALAELQRQRDALQPQLQDQRQALASLLRGAYARGDAAPLKLLLAQDTIADASRVLTWHRYLQRDRATRIGALAGQLRQLDELERQIAAQRGALDATRAQQDAALAQLQRDRSARAGTVADLERRYRDRSARERALGRDAKGLERLLAQLRAATRAEATRKAAASRGGAGEPARKRPAVVANATPVSVGGLGWPLSGQLLAGFGGTLPDGRASSGVLIGAPAGSTVHAVADGTVVFADWMNGYGLILIVDHGNGTMSLYAHNEALLRDVGAVVHRGDALASVGNSGGQGRPGLYFELRRNGQPVNPATWLQKR